MFEKCGLDCANTTGAENSLDADADLSRLLTIKQFCAAFPWPTESAMRSYIFRAEELGLSSAFVRVRRRVLIMPQSFFSLIKQLESRSGKGSAYDTSSWRKGKAQV